MSPNDVEGYLKAAKHLAATRDKKRTDKETKEEEDQLIELGLSVAAGILRDLARIADALEILAKVALANDETSAVRSHK